MSDPANINYQPLDAMKGAYSTVLTNSLNGRGLSFVILVLFSVLEIGIIVAGHILLIIYPFFFYFMYLSVQVSKYKNGVWQSFALANGWPLDANTPPAELVPPSLQFGHSPHTSPVINAQLGNIACDLSLYECTTGSGKYTQTHFFTVARVPLPKTLPHILLRSKKSKAYIQRDLADSQDLQLEGNFDDYFKLQIEKDQQVDALTVLTPDVMQILVNYNNNEDVEILGNDLFFMLSGDKRDAADTKSLIQSVLELSTQIIQNINLTTVNVAGQAPSMTPSAPAATASPIPPVVTAGGA